MPTDCLPPAVLPASLPGNSPAIYTRICDYYATAGPDYATWSPSFHMHFGYFRRFRDLFSLERMLENMNDIVLEQLRISPAAAVSIADLGCGMATVARYAARKFPRARITGVTIVKEQVEQAIRMNEKAGLAGRVNVLQQNFEDLDVPGERFTHVYAIESACHAHSANKALFIAEMARVLQRGGRFCIADGFLKKKGPRPWLFRWLYQKMTRYWAVPGFATIDDFKAALEAQGLKNIQLREISYRIAPSVLYVPLKCLQFFITELWKNRSLRMKKERWHNVYAPLLGMFVGLYRKQFGYYLVSGEKE